MKKHVKHSKVKSKSKIQKKAKKANNRRIKNGSTLKATELLRDVINLIAVYKTEAKQDAATRIDPDTADELMEKLEQVAKAL